MPFTALRPNQKATDKVRQAAIDYDREQRARDAAIAESGRDPFTVRLESQIPLNRAFEADRAAGGGLTGFLSGASQLLPGMQFRGGMGDPMDVLGPLMKRISGVARGMNTKNAEDLSQQGTEAVLNTMKEKSLSGPEAVGVARNAMRNYMRVQQGGQGVRRGAEATAVRNAVDQFGHQNEFQQLYQARKAAPGLTIDEFRRIRDQMAATKRPVSIDAPIREGESTSMADLLRNTEDPAEAAMLNERYNTLTDAQKANLDKHLSGETIHRQILDRILKKMGMRAPTKPISGGSAGDMSIQEYIQALKEEQGRLAGGAQPNRFEGFNTPTDPPADYQPFVGPQRGGFGPDQLTKNLWHATPAGPGIEATGVLEARRGITSGGLGGDALPGVSTTQNPADAFESMRLLNRSGYAARNGITPELLTEMIRTDLRRAGYGPEFDVHIPNMVKNATEQAAGRALMTPSTKDANALETVRGYYQTRHYPNEGSPNNMSPAELLRRISSKSEGPYLGNLPTDPHVMMPDMPAEYAIKVNRIARSVPSGFRAIEIPKEAIPPKAQIFEGSDPGEWRIGSDVLANKAKSWIPAAGSILGLLGLNTLRGQEDTGAVR